MVLGVWDGVVEVEKDGSKERAGAGRTGGSRQRPGQAMLPRSFIDARKRERCAVAIAELVQKPDSGRPTTAQIVKQARIGRAAFYELFGSLDGALEFACAQAGSWLSAPVARAGRGPGSWAERLAAAIEALARGVAERPAIAELYFVHRPRLLPPPEPPDEVMQALAIVLEEDRPYGRHPLGNEHTELVCGGVVSVLRSRLRRDAATTTPALTGELVQLALACYGPTAATDARLRTIEGRA